MFIFHIKEHKILHQFNGNPKIHRKDIKIIIKNSRGKAILRVKSYILKYVCSYICYFKNQGRNKRGATPLNLCIPVFQFNSKINLEICQERYMKKNGESV